MCKLLHGTLVGVIYIFVDGLIVFRHINTILNIIKTVSKGVLFDTAPTISNSDTLPIYYTF